MTASTPLSAVWGSLVTGGFAAGGIPYIASDNTPTVDISNLFWDATNKQLHVSTVGDQTGTDSINVYKQINAFNFNSAIPGSDPWVSQFPPGFSTRSARGNANAKAASQSGDYLGGLFTWGYIPTVVGTPIYYPAAGIWGAVGGADANGNFGGVLHFGIKADSGVFTDYLFLTNENGTQFGPSQVDGDVNLGGPGLTSGGVGTQTINKTTGRSSIAAGQTSVGINNNKVGSGNIVICQLETVDATAKSLVCVPGVNSFTVTLNAACTAQVTFSFLVLLH
jgi:hypothetical protein